MNVFVKKIKNSDGLTLTELIVASVLIGITMVGIVSFNFAMAQLQDTSAQSSLSIARASTSIGAMQRDAMLAVGDPSDMGVRTSAGGEAICFRHASGDPLTYADDNWQCFYQGGSGDLHRRKNVPLGFVPDTSHLSGVATRDPTFETIHILNPQAGIIVTDANGRLDHIALTLTLRKDATIAAHPITNPEITLTTRVSPPGHSR